ncbi:competence protein ComK [Staphylococcus pasteuri]|uniref:competence protein ComK n=1 Tax=Staphylococcus TaxID=1279 RepID=UPI00086C85C7|nr:MULTISPECIES: competence protein ComK [Staphylococcus]ODB33953.1 competence protein ComK [Staphylococcus sp. AOAB]RQX29358.1 competence protein ComK [Staphylococcus warneri]MCO0860961.1 competence protein ComK [Staphylococcus pasteuri]MCO5359726.1 competence protein ComK [Staphylococcus pasteuri]OFV05950.1 competence protein ComK [Staphylococcus sp. HMSC13A10]
MNHLTTTNLLYIQTEISDKLSTKWQYKQYDISLPISINNTLDYMLELHQKTLPLQKKIAKRLLHINKKIPIYVCDQLILFPLKHRRSPIQYYINAYHITGKQTKNNGTLIMFSNATHLLVDEPYHAILKKWQESLLLCHLITQSYSSY